MGTKPTASYTGLSRVTDEAVRAALKVLMDRVSTLEAALQTPDQGLNGNNVPVKNVADPRSDTDAVNLGYLRRLLADWPRDDP